MNTDRKVIRASPCNPWLVFWGDKLDFQVNNETYYLGLADDERQWLLFVETPNGTRRIPVYEDAAASDDGDADVKVVIEDKRRRKLVN